MGTTWHIDGEVLLALRLNRIEEAIAAKQPDLALLEAEELLDEHPSHPLGLFYTGQAALMMGAAHTARAALERCAVLRPGDATLQSALATACFECGDFDRADAAARSALAQAPDIATAWYTRGVISERRGDAAGAQDCFERAEALDPENYPTPLVIPNRKWEKALLQAIRVLPTAIQAFYIQVPVRWEEYPLPEDLTAQFPSISPLTGALYQGTPPDDDDPWQVLPASVRLYRGNLKHNVPPGSSLVERISQSLLNEALSWTGTPSEEVLTD